MNKHCKALINLGTYLLAFVIATAIVFGAMAVFIWCFGESIAIGILIMLCLVGLYVKSYRET